jgi:hypothetical protein
MGEVYKKLGAVLVIANTNTLLYEVPIGMSTILSSLTVCNQSSEEITFRIAHVSGPISGVTRADYIYFDVPMYPNDSFETTRGIAMSEGDTLLVRANSSDVSFISWGAEIPLEI